MIAAGAGGTIAQNDVTEMANLIEQKTGYLPTVNATRMEFRVPTGAAAGTAGNGLVLQIGDTADSFNQITVSIDDMSSKGIGVAGIDISSREGAAAAIDTIRAGIDKVSRSALFSAPRRTAWNIRSTTWIPRLKTSRQPTAVSATQIAAKMMMEYTKMNVLTQSAQAMLAQANQQPQSVLQLLQ